MRNIHTILAAACALATVTTANAQQVAPPAPPATSAAPQAVTSAMAPIGVEATALADPKALTMLERGENWSGVNALQKVVAKRGGVMNRFNLATGYQRTGRLDQAKTIYQDLLTDGQYTTAVASPGAGRDLFNVADEAASRLLYIKWLQSGDARREAKLLLSGAMAAEAAGVPVAALEGGPKGEVSDAEAAALDQAARGVSQ